MQKIKTFFTTLFRSFTDPGYYQAVVNAPTSFSFKYFFVFYIFLSLIVTSTITYTVLRQAPDFIDRSLQTVSGMYPTELVLTFDTQTAEVTTSGVEEPIIIPMLQTEYITTDLPNLIVIDTAANAEAIQEYQTAVLLTKKHFVTIAEDNNGFQIFPLSDIAEGLKDPQSGHSITSITINKTFIDSNLPQVKKVALTIIRFLPYALFFGLLFGYLISRLFYLLFMTLLTSIINLILGKSLSYTKLFQIGLHTITVADGITKLQQLVFHTSFPMLYTFAFLGITLIALLGIKPATNKT